MKLNTPQEYCEICGCKIHRHGKYAEPSVVGRSHATKHHYVALRFLNRISRDKTKSIVPIFKSIPWKVEKETGNFCYECHEELLHNPVLLPDDICRFYKLIKQRGLNEIEKTEDRAKIAGRVKLLHEVIEKGIKELLGTKSKNAE